MTGNSPFKEIIVYYHILFGKFTIVLYMRQLFSEFPHHGLSPFLIKETKKRNRKKIPLEHAQKYGIMILLTDVTAPDRQHS